MKKRTLYYSGLMIAGLILIGLGFAGITDEFWSGMGSALAMVGSLRLLRSYRLNKNQSYREKMEVEVQDERNQFLRSKAWAWAGYLFILIVGMAVILFKLAGQDLLSMPAGWAVCLMLILYWISYWVLRKKY